VQRSAADSFQESERLNPVDKNNSPFDAILRGAMSQTPNAVSPECPDAAILAAYYDRSVNAAERARLEIHIADCARCQMQLAAIAHSDAVASDTTPARRLITTLRGWRIVIPALAAAAALIVTILTMRPGRDDLRNQQLAALSRRDMADKLAGAAQRPEAPPAPTAPEAPNAATFGGGLAMNEPRAARAPESEAVSGTAASAKALAKQKMPETKRTQMAAAGSGIGTTSSRPGVPIAAAESPTVAKKSDQLTATARAAQVAAPPAVAPGERSLQSFARSYLPGKPESASGAGVGVGAGAQPPGAANAIGGTGTGLPGTANVYFGAPGALASISSPDRTNTWIVGRNGKIVLRDARGYAHAQSSGVTTDLTAGAAVSAQVCWVVGRSGTIVRTIDGEHWELVPSPTRDNLASVAANSADEAIVTVAGGQSFATSDGGRSWHPQ
jgi:hypothetical protein